MKMSFKLLLCVLYLVCSEGVSSAKETSFTFPRFGKVVIMGEKNKSPTQFVLFLAGDGGWNQGVIPMAQKLVSEGAIVAGVDTAYYLKQLREVKAKCHYPAADLESLGHFIQKKLNFPKFISPTLVGYSSGATLAYATLVEAPPGTFRGGIGLGFCSDLKIDRTLCKGHGITSKRLKNKKFIEFYPVKKLERPFYILNGDLDETCSMNLVRSFVKDMEGAHLVELPKVGHGFSKQKNWFPQYSKAINELNAPEEKNVITATSESLRGLPLVEGFSSISGMNKNKLLAIILSGDGGWVSIDKEIAKVLQNEGIPIIGLDSLRYFWKSKTPEILSQDIENIISYYLKSWKLEKVLLIGYSMGADVLPFALSRLPSTVKSKVIGSAYLGLSKKADFEFHLSNWLNTKSSQEVGMDILPELKKIPEMKSICLKGSDEEDSGCDLKVSSQFKTQILDGGHHLGGDFKKLADIILNHFVP